MLIQMNTLTLYSAATINIYICDMQGLNKETILSELNKLNEVLNKRYHVVSIGLFGSFARNEQTENSDIDLLVEFDVPLADYIENRFALQDFLASHFSRKIDLANPHSLKPFYKKRILDQLAIPISI